MKSLRNFFEAIGINTYRDFHYIDRQPTALGYMNEFWGILKEYAKRLRGFISRNEYRIYIPIPEKYVNNGNKYTIHYEGNNKLLRNGMELRFDVSDLDILADTFCYKDSKNVTLDQDGIPNTEVGEFIDVISQELSSNLSRKGIQDCNIYLANNIMVYVDEYGRERRIKVTKLIRNPKILELYNRFLNFLATPKKNLLLCISNHKYDIAGMSTDRNWVSCMELVGNLGPINHAHAREAISGDIENGMLVAYIIADDDLNINNPFGRISIVPTVDRNNHIVYMPEKTVYSPYMSLFNVYDFVIDIICDIYDTPGYLQRLDGMYADTYHKGVDSGNGFNIKPHGYYSGYYLG